MKIDGLGFTEAVERLADKYGVTAAARGRRRPREERPRGPQRQPAGRGQPGRPGVLRRPARVAGGVSGPAVPRSSAASTRPAAEQFGIGFAPRDGEALLRHLRQKGFRDEESVAAGLVALGPLGLRPVPRPAALADPRRAAATPSASARGGSSTTTRSRPSTSTPPRRRSTRRARCSTASTWPGATWRRTSQAVVVEGYTDVMACHLAGVPTAVATCGTAFGDDHARVLRRFLHDHEEFRGEVIFTFDGDAAGQKAALRAFAGDQNFVSQTYVAVEPSGLDPCDLRHQAGRRRGARAGRAAGAALPLRARQRRRQVRPRPGRRPGRRRARGRPAGVEHPRQVQGRRLRPRAGRAWSASTSSRPATRYAGPPNRRPDAAASAAAAVSTDGRAPSRRAALPDLRDPRFAIERETLKLVLQHPAAVGRTAARRRRQRLHPPDLPRRLGAGREDRRPARPPTPAGRGGSAPTPPTRRCVGGQRAGRRAAA